MLIFVIIKYKIANTSHKVAIVFRRAKIACSNSRAILNITMFEQEKEPDKTDDEVFITPKTRKKRGRPAKGSTSSQPDPKKKDTTADEREYNSDTTDTDFDTQTRYTRNTNQPGTETHEAINQPLQETTASAPRIKNAQATQSKVISTALNASTQIHTSFKEKMRMINKTFANTYNLTPKDRNYSRYALAEEWETLLRKHNVKNEEDVIIKTKEGFVLKTNLKEELANTLLAKLPTVKDVKINTRAPMKTSDKKFEHSYSAIIDYVDYDIPDEAISQHLKSLEINHRYCKRIIARATNRPTKKVRVITACQTSYEKLLRGLYFKYRHHPVIESYAPPPLPQPCNKCNKFDHITEMCRDPITCGKCSGPHPTNSCSTNLPERCKTCNLEGHTAWSMKCPRRPKTPIDGIPNIPARNTNKKSADIKKDITNNSRIHTPLTIHDHIINTYTYKINNNKNSDRQDLITKLKQRFIAIYRVDTVVSFSGNRFHIIMFDLDNLDANSPTEPLEGEGVGVAAGVVLPCSMEASSCR